jgi:hypothetical protein
MMNLPAKSDRTEQTSMSSSFDGDHTYPACPVAVIFAIGSCCFAFPGVVAAAAATGSETATASG